MMSYFYKICSFVLIFTFVSCYSKPRVPAENGDSGSTPGSQNTPVVPLDNAGNISNPNSDNNPSNPASGHNLQPASNSSLDSLGYSPLHLAAQFAELAKVQSLVQQGADVNLKNPNNGYTPLHSAAMGNSLEVVKFLVENGAQVTDQIISHAQVVGASPAIIQYLESSRSSTS